MKIVILLKHQSANSSSVDFITGGNNGRENWSITQIK